MIGLRIEDGTNKDPTIALPPGEAGFLSFGLAEILNAIGDDAVRSEWQIRDLDCFGDGYADFVAACEGNTRTPGKRLLELATHIKQIIDGEFEAFDGGRVEPRLRIKAVDSSWWEVWTNDEATQASIRSRFRAVTDISEQAA